MEHFGDAVVCYCFIDTVNDENHQHFAGDFQGCSLPMLHHEKLEQHQCMPLEV